MNSKTSAEVLVCEDNLMTQDLMGELLKKIGVNTTFAENGKKAVDLVKERNDSGKNPFGLILMDIHMPVMDGLEATAIISEMKLGTPIVAVTANVRANQLEHYREIGIPDCVPKPINAEKLQECVEKYIKKDEGEGAADKEHANSNDTALFKLAEKLEPLLLTGNAACMDLLDEVKAIPGTEKLVWHVEEFEFQKAVEELRFLRRT